MFSKLSTLMGLLLAASSAFAHGPLLDEKAIVGVEWLNGLYEETLQKNGGKLPRPVRTQSKKGVRVGDIESFWTLNVATKQPMQIEAELRHIGKNCYIYLELEQDLRVTQETLENLAKQFDEGIYPTNHKFFGTEDKPGIDFDDRVTLLFLNIQDGWEPGKGYVAGYFSPMDGVSSSLWDFSNEREMVYLDVYPGDPKRPDYLGILAHEFQHMQHANYDRKEELWLNEAMSQIAFYVNDFGHAPQILAFIKNADTQIDEFNNGLDDYGSVYLFVYYLLTKHIGSLETAAPILKEIVASKDRGLASVEAVLHKNGINVNLEEVIADWLIANFVNDPTLANGKYGYDNTLPMKVQPSHHFRFDQMPAELSDKVNQRAADYIVLSDEVRSHPMNATLIDKIKIFSDFEGTIKWNINEDTLPPTAFIPEGASTEGNQVIQTTQKDEEGRFFIEVGPFRGGGLQVTKINYEATGTNASTNGIVPVFSFQTLSNVRPTQVTISFDGKHKFFIGKEKKMRLTKLIEKADGQKLIEEVMLDSKNDAQWTENLEGVKTLTLMPVSTLGGELDYTVKFQTNQPSRELSVLDEWAADEDKFLQKMIDYPNLIDALKSEWLKLSSERKERLGKDFRSFLHRYQFKFLNTLPMDSLYEQPDKTDHQKQPRDSDEDTSHNNLKFLLKKAREGTHGLSHLKIDPNFIEGQLMKYWKLLHIARGFPKWPLPEGLGIVDYDVSSIESLLADWEENGSVDDFETIRRLTLGQQVILGTYDQGLTMADDAGAIVMDMVTLFMSARWASSLILDPIIKSGGVKGKLADAVKTQLKSKLLWVLNKLAALVSRRLRPPYNTSIPTAVALITEVYRRINKIPLEYEYDGWLKPFAYRTLAKYALMSLPKIGIVARGQKNVEHLAAKAVSGETTFTVEDAADDVRLKLQDIFTDIAATHAATEEKRQWADVAKKVTEISALGFALDPTNISKIVMIASTVVGGGILSHSLYKSTKTLYGIPESLVPAIDASFKPFENQGDGASNIAPKSLNLNVLQLDAFEARLQNVRDGLLQSIADVETADLTATLERFLREEESYSKELKQQEMLIIGSSGEVDETIMTLTQNELLRSRLSIALLLEDRNQAVKLAAEIRQRETKNLNDFRSMNLGRQQQHVVSVSKGETTISGKDFVLTLEVQAMTDFPETTVRIYTGQDISLNKSEFKISPSTKSITVKGERDHEDDSLLHVIIEGPEGVTGYSTTINF